MNFTNAFEFPDTDETLGMGAWRAFGTVSPIASSTPPATAALQFDLLDDAFCLSRDESVLTETENAELTRLKVANAALTAALHHEKESAVATEAELERLRTHTSELEAEFERVRDRAMDLILSRTAEVDRLKKELAAMTADRNMWKVRHATVRQSAERLHKKLDEARGMPPPRLAPRMFHLNPDAPEFIPTHAVSRGVVPAFMEAPPSFKATVRARLAALGKAPVAGSC